MFGTEAHMRRKYHLKCDTANMFAKRSCGHRPIWASPEGKKFLVLVSQVSILGSVGEAPLLMSWNGGCGSQKQQVGCAAEAELTKHFPQSLFSSWSFPPRAAGESSPPREDTVPLVHPVVWQSTVGVTKLCCALDSLSAVGETLISTPVYCNDLPATKNM